MISRSQNVRQAMERNTIYLVHPVNVSCCLVCHIINVILFHLFCLVEFQLNHHFPYVISDICKAPHHDQQPSGDSGDLLTHSNKVIYILNFEISI